MAKKFVHIHVDEDALEKIYWAKTKAMAEEKKGLRNGRVKSHSDAIVWMYEKIQELSKVLKEKIAEEYSEEKDNNNEETKNEKKTEQSSRRHTSNYK